MTTAVEMTALRIEAIEWELDLTRARLHVQLVREYLRRMALWAQSLGVPQEWPFFDVANAVDPTVRADAETILRVREHLDAGKASWWGNKISEWALHFAALQPQRGLPDPYEPLLVLFDQGGDFSTESGFIDVDYQFGIHRGKLSDHLSDEPVIAV
jgi:hypothetical protein